jgi:hypothetical protein
VSDEEDEAMKVEQGGEEGEVEEVKEELPKKKRKVGAGAPGSRSCSRGCCRQPPRLQSACAAHER